MLSAARQDLALWPFTVKTQNETYIADAIIATNGADPRKLGIPGEKDFTGRGVSYCATCDGFFFRGKKIIVVGGGDSALQEAIFLTKFANVNIIHRRNELRADISLQKRAFANPKIAWHWNAEVDEHMIAVNEQMGFRPTARGGQLQKKL